MTNAQNSNCGVCRKKVNAREPSQKMFHPPQQHAEHTEGTRTQKYSVWDMPGSVFVVIEEGM